MSTDHTVGPSSTDTSQLPQIIKTVSAKFNIDIQTAKKIHNFYYQLARKGDGVRCAVCLEGNSVHFVYKCNQCYYIQCVTCEVQYGGCWRAKFDETH